MQRNQNNDFGIALPSYGNGYTEMTPHYRRIGDDYVITLILSEVFGGTRIESVHERVALGDEDDAINEVTDMQWRASDYFETFDVRDAECEGDWGRHLIRILDAEKAAFAIAAE